MAFGLGDLDDPITVKEFEKSVKRSNRIDELMENNFFR